MVVAMTEARKLISIVMPCFNEEKTLHEVVSRVLENRLTGELARRPAERKMGLASGCFNPSNPRASAQFF